MTFSRVREVYETKSCSVGGTGVEVWTGVTGQCSGTTRSGEQGRASRILGGAIVLLFYTINV